jgi:gamma-glutamyltranspeptidase/glutathione hydrolase
MAATSHPLATQIAIDTLKAGGSAVDAAIAANAALGLMEPVSCGIGGDLFAIVWDNKSQKLHGLNASGRSPRGLTRDEFVKRKIGKIPSYGPLPISVPGCVDGWFELHGKFGRLPMSDLLAPTIRYAREGVPVPEVIAYYWNSAIPTLQDKPGFAATFMPGGRAPKYGELFHNPHLATTLNTIAEEGRDAFYRGEMARRITAFVQAAGGFLAYEDLASHTSTWVQPVSTNYRGYTIWELPPNGQGIAALQILNVLEGFDLKSMGFGSTDHLHAFVEAKKLAFADRAKFYADPEFNEIPVAQLISKPYADRRRSLIDPHTAAKEFSAGEPKLGDTIYLTVADRDRNMVSLIQSNFRGFGSGVCPTGLGFGLQNRGELFTLQEDHFNAYAPGKRPFHTIIPAFITKDGAPYISFGVMGGAMQPQGHAQIVVNLVDFGMNLQEAGDAPRIRHTGSSQPTGEQMSDGGIVHLENGFANESVRDLVGRGHTVQASRGGFGGYQAIRYDAKHDVYYGASESRKDGFAAGY